MWIWARFRPWARGFNSFHVHLSECECVLPSIVLYLLRRTPAQPDQWKQVSKHLLTSEPRQTSICKVVDFVVIGKLIGKARGGRKWTRQSDLIWKGQQVINVSGHPNSAQPNRICEIPHRVPNTVATGTEEIASRDQEDLLWGTTHINYCWLFNDRWLILYPVKRLEVMYEISSSTQSRAQGQEQQDPCIHALKRNGSDGCTAHRSTCSTSDSTHLHTQVLRQRWISAASCTNTVVMHVYPFWLPLCVFPNCRFFCTQPGVYFLHSGETLSWIPTILRLLGSGWAAICL